MMHWNTFCLKTYCNQQNSYRKFHFYSNQTLDSELLEHALTNYTQENCCHPDLCKGDAGEWKSIARSYQSNA